MAKQPDKLTFRVFANRADNFPQVVSVDEGNASSEFTCIGVRLESGVTARTRYITPADPKTLPSFWLEVTGRLYLEHGRAIFRP